MNFDELLKEHKLKKTEPRLKVLQLFKEEGKAYSHSELQLKLGGAMDRVTLYRILDKFEDKGILHKVPDNETTVKYALCKHHISAHHHTDNHLHFKCNICGDTTCLEDSEIPTLKVPSGFKIKEQYILLSGTCKHCA